MSHSQHNVKQFYLYYEINYSRFHSFSRSPKKTCKRSLYKFIHVDIWFMQPLHGWVFVTSSAPFGALVLILWRRVRIRSVIAWLSPAILEGSRFTYTHLGHMHQISTKPQSLFTTCTGSILYTPNLDPGNLSGMNSFSFTGIISCMICSLLFRLSNNM